MAPSGACPTGKRRIGPARTGFPCLKPGRSGRILQVLQDTAGFPGNAQAWATAHSGSLRGRTYASRAAEVRDMSA